ncbi:TPA: general stress protein [Bacillus thuringiensis]|uniref:General stress protein n=3 Tax=Bacillus cereus group TaxID=86661 RepID=A0A9X6QBJ6_BACTU|nr:MULTISPECIES: general stress protein [Bacillus]NIE91157.1 general stress protein [Bacillus sp. Ab-1751]AGE78410.1 General stress protein 17M [Bacillus thuringiensis serovar kurstaki str. HD73]AHZ51464.1 General stress protein 17M [Bacillus thuringiensis serovar kurstaki str. YBT-1520]AIE33877.1 General stress protein 17M [Bacillus thuringiensis serovar kurstaki str. HD-1]AJA20435.1 general stress protein [Bacillus thuringiensis serovar galleriae]
MHKNERKPVVYEYQNEQEVVMKVKELELQGIHQDDIYVLTHEKHITKKIADDTNTNTIGVKEQGLGTSIINFFSKKGDELRNQMEEMGLSKEEANLYEEKLDQGRILLLVTDETLTASDRQPQNYHSL